MRIITFLLFLLSFFLVNSQTWKSIDKNSFYQVTPNKQFSFNPYLNQLWLVNSDKVSVIEEDGTLRVFDYNQLGEMWTGSKIKFVFTPTHVYYARNVHGLCTFDNYVSVPVFEFQQYYGVLKSDNESIYILGLQDMWDLTVYSQSAVDTTYLTAEDFAVKNNILYVKLGSANIAHYLSTWPNINLQSLQNDPEYLNDYVNEMKFSSVSDTLFVASRSGISKSINYDFVSSITPNNSINMPSSNVLEMEFDSTGKLWAVFGLDDNTPFAISCYVNGQWSNQIDTSNSPIDFNNFLGLEVDNTGNIWVADKNYLHTLLTTNSPSWLGLNDLTQNEIEEVFPNPFKNEMNLISKSTGICELIDQYGTTLETVKLIAGNNTFDFSSLKPGLYFLKLGDKVSRIIKN